MCCFNGEKVQLPKKGVKAYRKFSISVVFSKLTGAYQYSFHYPSSDVSLVGNVGQRIKPCRGNGKGFYAFRDAKEVQSVLHPQEASATVRLFGTAIASHKAVYDGTQMHYGETPGWRAERMVIERVAMPWDTSDDTMKQFRAIYPGVRFVKRKEPRGTRGW